MKTKKHISYGEVDEHGRPSSYDKEGVLEWHKQHPGRRIEVTYRVINEEDKTASQRGYYFGVVVPNLRQGFANLGIRMSEARVHEELRKNSSVRVATVDIGKHLVQIIDSVGDFEKDDWRDYLEEVIQFGAEELHVVIPEPVYERYSA